MFRTIELTEDITINGTFFPAGTLAFTTRTEGPYTHVDLCGGVWLQKGQFRLVVAPVIRCGVMYHCYRSENPKGRTPEPTGSADSWECWWLMPANVTDAQIACVVSEPYSPLREYDCTGEVYIRGASIQRGKFHTLVRQSGGHDV